MAVWNDRRTPVGKLTDVRTGGPMQASHEYMKRAAASGGASVGGPSGFAGGHEGMKRKAAEMASTTTPKAKKSPVKSLKQRLRGK